MRLIVYVIETSFPSFPKMSGGRRHGLNRQLEDQQAEDPAKPHS
jgi:hypothetical protein